MHLHALHELNHPPLTSQGFSPGQGARGEAMAGMHNERREACVHGVALGNSVRKATQQTSFCSKCRNALVSSCWRCLLGAVVAPWMVANKASCAIMQYAASYGTRECSATTLKLHHKKRAPTLQGRSGRHPRRACACSGCDSGWASYCGQAPTRLKTRQVAARLRLGTTRLAATRLTNGGL